MAVISPDKVASISKEAPTVKTKITDPAQAERAEVARLTGQSLDGKSPDQALEGLSGQPVPEAVSEANEEQSVPKGLDRMDYKKMLAGEEITDPARREAAINYGKSLEKPDASSNTAEGEGAPESADKAQLEEKEEAVGGDGNNALAAEKKEEAQAKASSEPKTETEVKAEQKRGQENSQLAKKLAKKDKEGYLAIKGLIQQNAEEKGEKLSDDELNNRTVEAYYSNEARKIMENPNKLEDMKNDKKFQKKLTEWMSKYIHAGKNPDSEELFQFALKEHLRDKDLKGGLKKLLRDLLITLGLVFFSQGGEVVKETIPQELSGKRG